MTHQNTREASQQSPSYRVGDIKKCTATRIEEVDHEEVKPVREADGATLLSRAMQTAVEYDRDAVYVHVRAVVWSRINKMCQRARVCSNVCVVLSTV